MRWFGSSLAAALVGLLLLPPVALVLSARPVDLVLGLQHPSFVPALALSLRTTFLSLLVVVATGTPLAWWLAASRSGLRRAIEGLVELPVVLPPAVLGVALLQAFGRRGLLGTLLAPWGVTISFSTSAVVLAQIVVSAPFYVQSAAAAFRRVDPDLLLVARPLGASRAGALLRVGLPVAAPALAAGASLAWARALGEFGATLLFAGNRPGVTQTLPLAIYGALEQDVRLAVVFSLVLAGVGSALLLGLRLGPRLLGPSGSAVEEARRR